MFAIKKFKKHTKIVIFILTFLIFTINLDSVSGFTDYGSPLIPMTTNGFSRFDEDLKQYDPSSLENNNYGIGKFTIESSNEKDKNTAFNILNSVDGKKLKSGKLFSLLDKYFTAYDFSLSDPNINGGVCCGATVVKRALDSLGENKGGTYIVDQNGKVIEKKGTEFNPTVIGIRLSPDVKIDEISAKIIINGIFDKYKSAQVVYIYSSDNENNVVVEPKNEPVDTDKRQDIYIISKNPLFFYNKTPSLSNLKLEISSK